MAPFSLKCITLKSIDILIDTKTSSITLRLMVDKWLTYHSYIFCLQEHVHSSISIDSVLFWEFLGVELED